VPPRYLGYFFKPNYVVVNIYSKDTPTPTKKNCSVHGNQASKGRQAHEKPKPLRDVALRSRPNLVARSRLHISSHNATLVIIICYKYLLVNIISMRCPRTFGARAGLDAGIDEDDAAGFS